MGENKFVMRLNYSGLHEVENEHHKPCKLYMAIRSFSWEKFPDIMNNLDKIKEFWLVRAISNFDSIRNFFKLYVRCVGRITFKMI